MRENAYINSIMKEENIIIGHCRRASEISENDASLNYLRNIENEIDKSVRVPFCIPFSEQPRQKIREWVQSSEIRLKIDFDFYHHTKEEIVEFAVKNRGNYNLLMESMNDLYLDEYPAPSASGKAYMVSVNGQHRRLVYSCIGLPKVLAQVQKTSGNKWRFYWKNQDKNAFKLLKWLKYKGIVECIEKVDHDTLVISDANNISGWIIPNPDPNSLYQMINDMQERAKYLKCSFNGLSNKVSLLFKHPFILYLSIQFTYFFREVVVLNN